ncbi:MAG: polyprenyl synthetase family protein [Candidatus Hydrogenedentes bacterium]|nr:polyprenyl synthetase family protein [Candidatus Hydrogenedentota bacterium]
MVAAELAGYLMERKALVDAALAERLPSEDVEPRNVHAAMRYAVLSGGKRLRPVLALAIAEIGGLKPEQILDAACAIEFVHAASLILDDLPAMDNSDMRRDQPATHRKYDEATAILAALALISDAYALLSKNASVRLDGNGVSSVVAILSNTIGTAGLIQGQHIDLTLAREAHTLEALESIYRTKAAVLFHAAVAIPASLAQLSKRQCEALEVYATNVGIAFQITDDIIDAHHLHSDGEQKVTFVTFAGEDGARRKAINLADTALAALDQFGERGVPLRGLAEYVASRTV